MDEMIISKRPCSEEENICSKKVKFDYEQKAIISKRPCSEEEDICTKKLKFDYEELCVMCGKCEDKKNKRKLSLIGMGSGVGEKLLNAAKIRGDQMVADRILAASDLNAVKARYHLYPCYQNYTSQSALNALKNESEKTYLHDEVASQLAVELRTKVFGEVVFLTDITKQYAEKLAERKGISLDEANKVKSCYVKSKMEKYLGDDFVFLSSKGNKSDILCPKNNLVDFLTDKIHKLRKKETETEETDRFSLPVENENLVLHKAAGILRKTINEIPATHEYPAPGDLTTEASRDFLPDNVKKFLSWVLDEKSYHNAELYEENTSSERYCLALAECMIFCSRRGKNQVIPPFHYGLALDLHHRFGSKLLIETLNAFGLCASYDELRFFLTAQAMQELKKNSSTYIPSGIIPKNLGGRMIHEGDDNIDINCETIDGKETYHSMGRVIFQDQEIDAKVEIKRLPRQFLHKTLNEESTESFKVLPYESPVIKPSPPRLKGVSKSIGNVVVNHRQLIPLDTTWLLLRLVSRGIFFQSDKGKQIIPAWIPFKVHFSEKPKEITKAKYLPAINAKPSDPATAYTTLKRGHDMMVACGQKYSIHTMDQQLYAVAQMIKFENPNEFSSTFFKLGGFHALNTYISCINKIWGDGGLKSMLADSGVYASNSVDQMLDGKQFHRAVRALTLIYEVLLQLLIEKFLEWMSSNGSNDEILKFSDKYSSFQSQYNSKDCTVNKLNILAGEVTEKSFLPLLNRFREEFRSKSATFEYWDNCLVALQLLKQYIAAERSTNWDSHISATANMLPYFFACDKPNYSRWCTLYVIEMLHTLPEEIREDFKKGHSSIKFTNNAFAALWSDMGVEMTVIRNSKGDSGIIGLTRKEPTVLRWTMTQNILGEYSAHFSKRSECQKKSNDFVKYIHEGEKKSMMERNEKDAATILQFVKSHMSDPFSVDATEKLINISNGVIVPNDVQESLLKAVDIGRQKLLDFVESAFEYQPKPSPKAKGFHDPITQVKLKTFSDLMKPTKVKSVKKFISPDQVFQRALAVSSVYPEVDLAKILSVPLTDVPTALFNNDGSKRMTSKSDMLHVLEKEVEGEIIVKHPNGRSILIIDGMAELHEMNMKNIKTFENLGDTVLRNLLKRLELYEEVHLIFDRYDFSQPYPKQEEQNRRTCGQQILNFVIQAEKPIPDSKKLFASNRNKSELTKFLGNYLKEHLPKAIPDNKKIYVAGALEPRTDAFEIVKNNFHCDVELSCNHIEADTRIIFHINKFQERQVLMNTDLQIVVNSPDTDVFILLIAHHQFFSNSPKIWFFTGKNSRLSNNRRYIPVHSITSKLNNQLAFSLLSASALTGCDTTSSFFGIGKKSVYTALKKLQDQDAEELGIIYRLEIDEGLIVATKFVSSLYDPQNKTKGDRKSINALRYNLSLKKNGSMEKLPPSLAAFRQHFLRARWQNRIWAEARGQISEVDILSNGWTLENDLIKPMYFEGISAVDLLKNYFCDCQKRKCSSEKCSCIVAKLKCSSICLCPPETCPNKI